MAVVTSENKTEILKRIVKIKKDGLLPTRYAKAIHTKYPHLSTHNIHNVANGASYNAEIVDAILELAEENKAAKQMERIENLYKD